MDMHASLPTTDPPFLSVHSYNTDGHSITLPLSSRDCMPMVWMLTFSSVYCRRIVHLNLKAGVVGIPFLNNLNCGSGAGAGASATVAATTMSTSTHVLYGVAGSTDGVAGLPLPTPPPAAAASPSMAGGAEASGTDADAGTASTPLTLAISSDLGKDTAVEIVPAVLENVSCSGKLALLAAGASGNKVLKVLTGEADAAVLNLKASKDESASACPSLCVCVHLRC